MEFRRVLFRSELVRGGLEAIAEEHDGIIADLRGTGLIQGMSTTVPEAASAITAAAFERGLVIETAGPADEVVKLLPPLIVTDAQIEQALDIIAESTPENGRAHVCTPVTNAHLLCRLLLDKKK